MRMARLAPKDPRSAGLARPLHMLVVASFQIEIGLFQFWLVNVETICAIVGIDWDGLDVD